MLIAKYVLWVVFFAGVFMVGSWIHKRERKLAGIFTHTENPSERACKFFHYTGEAIQIVGAVVGFVEAVAVLVLVF